MRCRTKMPRSPATAALSSTVVRRRVPSISDIEDHMFRFASEGDLQAYQSFSVGKVRRAWLAPTPLSAYLSYRTRWREWGARISPVSCELGLPVTRARALESRVCRGIGDQSGKRDVGKAASDSLGCVARPLHAVSASKRQKPKQIACDRYKINGQGERCANEKIVGQPEGGGHEKDHLHPRR